MSLSPGDPWGRLGEFPPDAPVVHSDGELAALLVERRDLHVVGLAGGDLCASLGGRGDIERRRGREATLATVDAGMVRWSGGERLFVAHCVMRGRWWRGEVAAAMNAERLGPWIVAPRAHPGDGLLDVVRGQLGARERLLARRRLRTGDHIPHPAISVVRTTATTLRFERPRRIQVDGAMAGAATTVEILLLPAAVTVAV